MARQGRISVPSEGSRDWLHYAPFAVTPPGLGTMSHALEIEGLEKVYANGLQALKGIDLRVAQGDFFAL